MEPGQLKGDWETGETTDIECTMPGNLFFGDIQAKRQELDDLNPHL